MRQRAMIAMALACEPAADRRRADDGARRHDPGADPRALEESRRRARHGADPDHARPRRRRRDVRAGQRHVRRHVRGDRQRRPHLRAAAAPATGSTMCRASTPAAASSCSRSRPAEHAERTGRVPVCSLLPLRGRGSRVPRCRHSSNSSRPPRPLLQPGPGGRVAADAVGARLDRARGGEGPRRGR